MIAPLDVFRIENRGNMWIDAADSLEHAIDLIKRIGTGEYLLFSQKTNHKDVYVVGRDGKVEFVRRMDEMSSNV